jgi:osmotically-inducible protein OsmY
MRHSDTRHTDTDIAQRAVDTLRWRSGIPAERLKTTVSNGWVTLEGDVNFHFQKQEAERAVSALTGVLGVTNKIRVIALTEVRPDDAEREIRDALVRRARLESSEHRSPHGRLARDPRRRSRPLG